jgi:hypothetical protein
MKSAPVARPIVFTLAGRTRKICSAVASLTVRRIHTTTKGEGIRGKGEGLSQGIVDPFPQVGY